MENYICLGICVVTIILMRFIFKISFKKAKKLEENKEQQIVTDRFPENIDIAKEMLQMINNTDVKVKQAKDTKTSLYIAITNKILIADLKDNYARIQTIAHECIHSVQDKTLLMFNFIFSNINILYFITVLILTVFKVIQNTMLQAFILLLLSIVQFSVRAFLEIDAMTKSKYLANEYIEQKKLCTEEETKSLINEYDKINKIGIPFIADNLLTNGILRIIIYMLILLAI